MELHQFFLFLAIILISARVFSETVARLGIPSVIGELLAGLLVGPSLLGWVSPDTTMKLLAEIGIILLLFEVGMDTNLSRLARSGSKPYIVPVIGFVLPFALGYWVSAWLFGLPELTALFIGGTLTATSIGITVRVLDDLGKRHTDEAQIVIGAAVLDDILGVLALAFLYQFAVEQQVSIKALGEVSFYIVLFMVLAPIVAKLAAVVIDRLDQHAATPGLLLTMALSLILLFSWVAHAVGAPEIMGGFAAGLAFSQHFGFRLWVGKASAFEFKPSPKLAHRLEEQMRPRSKPLTSALPWGKAAPMWLGKQQTWCCSTTTLPASCMQYAMDAACMTTSANSSAMRSPPTPPKYGRFSSPRSWDCLYRCCPYTYCGSI